MLINKMKALRPKTLAAYPLRPLSELRAAYKQLDQADQPTMPVALEMANGIFVRAWAALHEKLGSIAPIFECAKTDFQEYDYPVLVDWADEFGAKIKVEFRVFKRNGGLDFEADYMGCVLPAPDKTNQNGCNFTMEFNAYVFGLFCSFRECEHFLPLSKDGSPARSLIEFCLNLLDM